MTFSIRNAASHDLPHLARIAFVERKGLGKLLTISDFQRMFDDPAHFTILVIGDEQGLAVGFSILSVTHIPERRLWILFTATDSNRRISGSVSALRKARLLVAQEMGFTELWASVLKKHPQAAQKIQTPGWEIVSETPIAYVLRSSLMERSDTSTPEQGTTL
jgi:hypothetical protein